MAVVRSMSEYQLVPTDHVCAGTLLFTVEGELTHAPTRYSIQVGPDLHIDLPDGHSAEEILDQFFWRFTNHSCAPSAMVYGRHMLALRCIEPWQQITFNYNTTEFDMAEPFDCLCGSDNCEGQIRGYRWLSSTARERIRPWLADHLRSISDGGVEPTTLGDGLPVALWPAKAAPCR
jgi:hypothetical protein